MDDPDDIRDSVMRMKRSLQDELFLEGMSDMSKLLFLKYNTLMAAGFNEDQALEIVKERGLQ